MKDMDLRRDVMDELELEPRLNAASIGVAVVDGVVTLTGHVPSYSEKLAIEKVVGRVNGVRGIAQEIDVRYPGARRSSDDEIAKRALKIIGWMRPCPMKLSRSRSTKVSSRYRAKWHRSSSGMPRNGR